MGDDETGKEKEKEGDDEEGQERLPLVAVTPQQQAGHAGGDENQKEEEEEEEDQEDKASAAAEMYTLLTNASGCKARIYKPELMNSECAVILKRIENESRQGNVNPDDPMAEKGKLYKSFKNDLKLFMRAVVRETI